MAEFNVQATMDRYLVGGAVRDELLGIPVRERDWVVVGATPEEMIKAGYTPVGRDFPVYLHPTTREEHALARTERKSGRGYAGFTCHASPDVTLEQDLGRRDLTINAMARSPEGELIDPYGGESDLAARLLRHVGPAFEEDPVRLLRLARFAARFHHLGFRIADETRTLLQRMVESGEVDHLVPERVWQELAQALMEQSPVRFFEVLQDCGALARLLPELVGSGETTWRALVRAGRNAAPLAVRFALLASELDPVKTASLCERLRAPGQERDLALLVSRHHAAMSGVPLSADDLLALMEHTDGLRRPQRLLNFSEACAALYPESASPRLLQAALRQARTISARDLESTGLQGPALGQALRVQRLHRIEELLE